jgi:hypothetical protein
MSEAAVFRLDDGICDHEEFASDGCAALVKVDVVQFADECVQEFPGVGAVFAAVFGDATAFMFDVNFGTAKVAFVDSGHGFTFR